MRTIAALIFVLVCSPGCGAAAPQHYNVTATLDCLQRTESTMLRRSPNGIFVAFASPDGFAAIEPVAVAFRPETAELVANSAAPTRLGPVKPLWTERRGDAEVWGLGPYAPLIAKRQHIPTAARTSAAKALGARVRPAIDACLKENER